MPSVEETLVKAVGRKVVIDTDTMYVYIGTVESVGEDAVTLTVADAHDMNDSTTTKEIYVHEARKHGVRANRERVVVRMSHVVSFSLLEDVIEY